MTQRATVGHSSPILRPGSSRGPLGGYEAAKRWRPHTINANQKEELIATLVNLQTLLRPGDDLGRPGSGLEVEAHSIALRIALLVRDTERLSRSADILAAASPVPLEYGNATIWGDIPTPNDLPARLRVDYPRSLEAQILAAMIECGNSIGLMMLSRHWPRSQASRQPES